MSSVPVSASFPMPPPDTGGPAGARRRARSVRAFALALVALLPAAVLVGLLATRIVADNNRLANATGAVELLRPLGALVAALADAQAKDASGGAVDAVRRASADVDAAVGAAPASATSAQITARWTDLKGRIALAAERSGTAAADDYGNLAGLALTASAAVIEPVDVGPLGDVAGRSLPAMIAASGKYVSSVSAVRQFPDDAVVAGRQAAARERVADLAATVARELQAAVDPASPQVGEVLLARSGDFRAALASLLPAATAPVTGDVDSVRARQGEVVRTGAELQRAALSELAARSGDRRAALSAELAVTWALASVALAVAGALLWSGLTRHRTEDVEPLEAALGPDGLPLPERDVVMVDARRLLAEPQELVRVGRAVRRRSGDEP